ncbi:MAG: HAD-superfamily hydrolase, subfamily variant 3 [Actinomycetia bacterium]|nr:HAD-superfamily hydrolase, subfamily variant 3 [Actinomycetes bacterium]
MDGVVVFDLFGVIARTQTPQARWRIEQLAGVSGEVFWDAYWECRPAYDEGQPSEEYWRAVANSLGTRFENVEALVAADLASWCDADGRMVTLVTELAEQGRTLGLLSNIIEDLVPRFEARHDDWLRHFASLTYSCRIGVAKPDPRAFEICAERLGVRPADVVFFDDNEHNVAAARKVGMTAELFVSPTQVRELLAV